MTTTKAPSKQAMDDAEELHVPCSCVDDETHTRVIAEALDDFAEVQGRFLRGHYDDALAALEAGAERYGVLARRNVALVAALKLGLSAIDMDDDMFHIDGVAVAEMEAALAADAKAGEDR